MVGRSRVALPSLHSDKSTTGNSRTATFLTASVTYPLRVLPICGPRSAVGSLCVRVRDNFPTDL